MQSLQLWELRILHKSAEQGKQALRDCLEQRDILQRGAEDRAKAMAEKRNDQQALLAAATEEAARRAAEVEELQAALSDVSLMAAQRASDSQLFSVRGADSAPLAGSISRSIFGAEPSSVLNRAYNGKWDYAKDDKGRAIVNSDPAHWPMILNWLSYEAVPEKPSPAFLAECRFWQLNRLLDRLLERDAPSHLSSQGINNFSVVTISQSGKQGFTATGSISHFAKQMGSGYIIIPFIALRSFWKVKLLSGEMLAAVDVLVELVSGAAATAAHVSFSAGPKNKIIFSAASTLKPSCNIWGAVNSSTISKLLLCPSILAVDGSLKFLISVLF